MYATMYYYREFRAACVKKVFLSAKISNLTNASEILVRVTNGGN